MSTNKRIERLISDSFKNAMRGEERWQYAAKFHWPVDLRLDGESWFTLRGLFNKFVRSNFSYPDANDVFTEEDILNNKDFQQFRDWLNDRGLDLDTHMRTYYRLHISNIANSRFSSTPRVRLYVVPFDGQKKTLEKFDFKKHVKDRIENPDIVNKSDEPPKQAPIIKAFS